MAISVVQTKSNSGGSSTTLAVTLTATAAQNTLICCVSDNNGALAVTGVATSGGQALTAALQETDSAGASAGIWYLDNVPAGQTSVTVTWSAGPSHQNAVVYEVSGVYAAGGSLDQSSAAFLDGASPSPWTSGTTATLSQAAEFVVGCSSQVGLSVVITGPAGYTNTIITSTGGICAGQKIVAATTGVVYAGSNTHSGTGHTATVIATFKAGTPPPANAPSAFYPPTTGRGKPAAVRGTGRSGRGAAYVAFPSAFYAPHKPAKGAAGAARGRSSSSPGAAYVAFPSRFTLPRKPARGAAAAVRGTTRQAIGTKYIHVVPPGPSPFTLPTGPAKGRPAIVRGTSRSSPGAPYFHVSAFILPTRPAKGAQATRRGTSASSPGAAYVTFPSRFTLPRKPARGAAAAVRGRGLGHAGARFVLIRISPFYAPHKPAKGASALRRGTGRGSITGHGSPVTPRQLILVLAARAGTDDYGNTYPQGILATEGVIEGPTLVGSDAFFYSGAPALGTLVQSITAADGTDQYGNAYIAGTTTYNSVSFWSAVSVSGGAVTWYEGPGPGGPWTVEAGIGFSFNALTGGNLVLQGTNGTLQLPGGSIPQSLSGSIGTLPPDGNSGTGWVTGERAFMNNNWVNVCNNNFAAIVAALQAAGIAI